MGQIEQRFTATETVSATVKTVAEEMAKLPPAAQRVQNQMRDIHAKGDPLKELERQYEKSLTTLVLYGKKELAKTEEIQLAKQKLLAQFEREREQIIKRIGEEEAKAAAASAKSAQGFAKGWKEPLAAVSQMANGAASAFGTAGFKAAGLANGIVGSFAAGGVAGLALGAGVAAVSELAGAFGKAQEAAAAAAKEAAAEWDKAKTKVEENIAALKEQARLRGIELRGDNKDYVDAQDKEAQARNTLAKGEDRLAEARERLARATEDLAKAGGIEGGAGTSMRIAMQAAITEAREGVREAEREVEKLRRQAAEIREMVQSLPTTTTGIGGFGVYWTDTGLPAMGLNGHRETPKRSGPAARPDQVPRGVRDDGSAFGSKIEVSNLEVQNLSISDRDFAEYLQLQIQQGPKVTGSGLEYTEPLRLGGVTSSIQRVENADGTTTFDATEAMASELAQATQDADIAWAIGQQARADRSKYEAVGLQMGQMVAAGLIEGLSEGTSDSDKNRALGKMGLQMAGAILSTIPGYGQVLGSMMNFTAGFLREGGSEWDLPQGRAGLPGLNYDAFPAYFKHPMEYTLSAPAVAAAGGPQVVDAYNDAARQGLPFGRGGDTIIQQVMAFDAPSLRTVTPRLEEAQSERLDFRQGAAYRDQLRRSVAERRIH